MSIIGFVACGGLICGKEIKKNSCLRFDEDLRKFVETHIELKFDRPEGALCWNQGKEGILLIGGKGDPKISKSTELVKPGKC